MDFERQKERLETAIANAAEMYRRDRRIAMLVDSSVVAARGEMGRHIDPERADEEAHRLAQRACAILASRIYTEDAEVHALKAERDQYLKIAERALMVRPSPQFVAPTE